MKNFIKYLWDYFQVINFGLLTAIIVLLLFNKPSYTHKQVTHITNITKSGYTTGDTLNKRNLLEYILYKKIKYPTIVFKQAMLETMHLKCDNCSLLYDNLFGFRLKAWISKSNPLGYIPFKEGWKASVDYYKKWQDAMYKGGDYYEFLNCLYKTNRGVCVRYAEDPKYTQKLKTLSLDYVD